MNDNKLLDELGKLRLAMSDYWIQRHDADDKLREAQKTIDELWLGLVKEQMILDAYITKKENNAA